MAITASKSKQEVDVELRNQLSEFLGKKFMCRKNCKQCWNTGVRVFSIVVGRELLYGPCTCLIAKKDAKDDKAQSA